MALRAIKKIILVTILAVLLCLGTATATQWNEALYLAESEVTVAWDRTTEGDQAESYEIVAVWEGPQGIRGEFAVGSTAELQIVVSRPRVGFFSVKVRAVNEEGETSDWAISTDPSRALVDGQPRGWRVYFFLPAPSDGGITSMSEVFDILQGYIKEAAAEHNLSPRLLSSMVHAESSYRPDAASPAGALGAMQLMPKTAESLGVTDALDPQQNINAGAKYLRQLLDMFDNDLDMALAAYHEGPTKVRKLGRVPRRKVTKDYIQKVKKYKQNPDKLRAMYKKSK